MKQLLGSRSKSTGLRLNHLDSAPVLPLLLLSLHTFNAYTTTGWEEGALEGLVGSVLRTGYGHSASKQQLERLRLPEASLRAAFGLDLERL